MTREIPAISTKGVLTQTIDTINSNFQIAEGIAKRNSFWTKEVEKLQSGLGVNTYFNREVPLGHKSTDYSNWVVFSVEDGYNIWKYPIDDYAYDENNQMRIDTKLVEFMGEPDSLAKTSFDKVYLLSGGVYTDYTAEAGTDKGDPIPLMASNAEYLLMGADEIVSGVDFGFFRPGRGYSIVYDYSTESGWGSGLTGYNGDSVRRENATDDWVRDGHDRLYIPGDHAKSDVEGNTLYWIRAKTTTVPTVKAQAFYIRPADSVQSILKLNQKQLIQEQIRRWCSFNGTAYLTIPNTGAAEYEGKNYLRSGSTAAVRKSYFTVNHTIEADYKKADYENVVPYRMVYSWYDESPQNDTDMALAYNIPGSRGHVMTRDGYVTAVSCTATDVQTGDLYFEVNKDTGGGFSSICSGVLPSGENYGVKEISPAPAVSQGDALKIILRDLTAADGLVCDVEVSSTRV